MTKNLNLSCKIIEDARNRFQNCLENCNTEGLVLEFGVFTGTTLHMIQEVFNTKVYGFDSWQGLPEDSEHVPRGIGSYHKGAFKQHKISTNNPNIELVDGWFNESLPLFVQQHSDPCRFIHIDSDNYNSAKDIFNNLNTQIVVGTVIQFDEYAAHEGWECREYQAFMEFVEQNNIVYEYLHRSSSHERVAVVIKGRS